MGPFPSRRTYNPRDPGLIPVPPVLLICLPLIQSDITITGLLTGKLLSIRYTYQFDLKRCYLPSDNSRHQPSNMAWARPGNSFRPRSRILKYGDWIWQCLHSVSDMISFFLESVPANDQNMNCEMCFISCFVFMSLIELARVRETTGRLKETAGGHWIIGFI